MAQAPLRHLRSAATSPGTDVCWHEGNVARSARWAHLGQRGATVWFTGLHEAQGHRYFNKEAHEQLLWWSVLPQLIVAAEKDPSAKSSATRITLRALEGRIDEATAAAAQSGYRLDKLLQPNATTTEKSLTGSAPAEEPGRSEDEPVPSTTERTN